MKIKENPHLYHLLSTWLVGLLIIGGLYLMDYYPDDLSYKLELKSSRAMDLVQASDDNYLYKAIAKDTYYLIDSIEQARKNAVDTSSQRILLTGDSMAEGLYLAFRSYAAHNDHYLKGRIWYSSLTIQWSKTDSLKALIKKYEPTFIIFTLGANELFRTDIFEREKDIQDIIAQSGDIPFIWVGPPNWKDDTGINEIIERNMPPNTFFLSKDLEFERERDGAHPTRASSRVWADTIATWIMNKSRYKIKLEKPVAQAKAN